MWKEVFRNVQTNSPSTPRLERTRNDPSLYCCTDGTLKILNALDIMTLEWIDARAVVYGIFS